jgi:hypothetical protein
VSNVTGARTLAVFTTIHPGITAAFLKAWYRSLRAQSDLDFDLWVALDAVSPRRVLRHLGEDPNAHWVTATASDSPASLRSRAIRRLVERYEHVVFVDSDDVLLPERVASARRALARADVYACAMRLIGESGRSLGRTFRPAARPSPSSMLPRCNAFGLSNTAYRTAVLRRCLPIPRACRLVDWYLATSAWARGARLQFDREPHMGYRLHRGSMAPVLAPFTADQVRHAASLVRQHYRIMLARPAGLQPRRRQALAEASSRLADFERGVLSSRGRLKAYVSSLNRLPNTHAWWDLVAHPALEWTWKS